MAFIFAIVAYAICALKLRHSCMLQARTRFLGIPEPSCWQHGFSFSIHLHLRQIVHLNRRCH
ncbi:hypothetical protein ES332_D04G149800v1 [Gossypium tomentosum]|uniref:Uncharacterized protein n=1 Tax=Gossypium tomentosum TaxID=34277 RepID=A0A5D2LE10_GOSTO|nr:hypothetical protein ES332_D04G149800v1 [Gossypium tomentosum]